MPTSPAQKLELTWIGKGEEFQLEPRILIEQPDLSAGDPAAENMLIHGDNLLALKALEQDFAGKIKCIYIDPPYNTGSAFAHYDDGVEHSQWLNLISPRLKLLRNLLAEDGSIWISIDDNEAHYLKVLCDEIFGRSNFVSNVIWEKKASPQANSVWLSDSHDHILVYAKNKESWRPNLLPRSATADARYSNPDNDSRGDWTSGDFTISLTGGQRGAQFAKTGKSDNIYEIVTPTGRKLLPASGRCWVTSRSRFHELLEDNRIWFGEKGNNVPRIKRFLSEVQDGIVAMTVWFRNEVGDNQESKREVVAFNSKNVFATPKPEKLLSKILTLATNPGDWVLDSFLGSGTTAAVAHKMGRRWVGVELGEHARTHCLPRLRQVVAGTDQGGISKTVGWQGGGGFKFYTLAPSLLNRDAFGNWVISREYNAQMLAAAVAKQEGFRYQPDAHLYWKQAQSSEQDFLFVTTQFLTVQALDSIGEQLRPEESLLVACRSYQPECQGRHPRVTLKKIPAMLLGRCEFGRDDYSLNIVNLPAEAPDEAEPSAVAPEAPAGKSAGKRADTGQLTLL